KFGYGEAHEQPHAFGHVSVAAVPYIHGGAALGGQPWFARDPAQRRNANQDIVRAAPDTEDQRSVISRIRDKCGNPVGIRGIADPVPVKVRAPGEQFGCLCGIGLVKRTQAYPATLISGHLQAGQTGWNISDGIGEAYIWLSGSRRFGGHGPPSQDAPPHISAEQERATTRPLYLHP